MTKVVGYTIFITKEEYEKIMEVKIEDSDFWLGYVMSRAEPSYIVSKDEKII